MDLTGKKSRNVSLLSSRFPNNVLQEKNKFSQRQETKTEPQQRNASTSKNADQLSTSDRRRPASPSKAGLSAVNQTSDDPSRSNSEAVVGGENNNLLANEPLRAETQKQPARDWVTRKISPASETNTTIHARDWVGVDKSRASEAETTIQPISSETEPSTETVTEDSHILPDAETGDDAGHASKTKTDAEQKASEEDGGAADFAVGNFADYDDIADFEVDHLNEDSSDEELPTLQEVFQRCQMIRRKRFYADISNVWADSDEIGDGLDTALSLVPERFWKNETNAKDISIEHLKLIVEEKKDVTERAQFLEYCAAAEGAQSGQTGLRRDAIATGGGRSSTILHEYLKTNLLKHHVPLYYFPSYLHRFKAALTQQVRKQTKSENCD